MNTDHNSRTQKYIPANLIGQPEHRRYIRLQAAYGVSHRGGVVCPFSDSKHAGRLVSNINLLSSGEHRQIIFSESVLSN